MATRKTQSKSRNTERTRDRAVILEERRKVRSDLGTYKSIMSVPEGEEYSHLWFRWVNDVDKGERILYFKRLGWKIWEGEMPESIGDPNQAVDPNVSAGSGGEIHAGGGTKAILMCIDKEVWLADQELKENKTRDQEKSIMRDAIQAGLEKRPV